MLNNNLLFTCLKDFEKSLLNIHNCLNIGLQKKLVLNTVYRTIERNIFTVKNQTLQPYQSIYFAY